MFSLYFNLNIFYVVEKRVIYSSVPVDYSVISLKSGFILLPNPNYLLFLEKKNTVCVETVSTDRCLILGWNSQSATWHFISCKGR